MYNVGTNHLCMYDYIGIIGAVATSVTALFIFLTWYDSFRFRRDNVLVTRFIKDGQFFIQVRPKKNDLIEDCEVAFDGKKLITLESPNTMKKIILVGEVENFVFWASDNARKDDKRYVVVFERGHRVFKKRFRDFVDFESAKKIL